MCKIGIRDPQYERPGAIAIDSSEHIFIAEGGNEYDGSKCWVVLENKKELIGMRMRMLRR